MRIEARQLTKKYQDSFALCLPHLAIESGEFFGLVGNNGAGKTTFFRLLLDLIQPTEGCVLSGNKNVAQDETWKTYTGSYLDEAFIIDFLTPEEFFRFVGKTYSMSDDEIGKALERLRAFLSDEILRRGKKYLRDFSKGNIQKVGIAAAMLSMPKVLILDEPFAHLDPTSQISLKRLLKDLHREQNTTILISSHGLNHVTEICTRIVLLEKGKILRDVQHAAQVLQLLPDLEAYFAVMS